MTAHKTLAGLYFIVCEGEVNLLLQSAYSCSQSIIAAILFVKSIYDD